MEDRDLIYNIRGLCMKIHRQLGCGLLENAYRLALVHMLRKDGYVVKTEVEIPVIIDEIVIPKAFRADIIVEDKVIIELKAVEELAPIHHLQIASYMQLTNLPIGLLVNFRSQNLLKGMYTTYLKDLHLKFSTK